MTNSLVIALLLLSISVGAFPLEGQFRQYTREYHKSYRTRGEEFYRMGVFMANSLHIAALNADPNDHATYGWSRFTDLTPSEAKAMAGLVVPTQPKLKFVVNYTDLPLHKRKDAIPDVWNWVQEGAVGGVKDQGSCGSCWTFSTAGNIESLYWLQNKKSGPVEEFSEQQLIDCDKSNFGCSGGWPYNAIDWLAHNGGLETDKDYPLRKNYSGPCDFSPSKARVQLKGYMNITHDEEIIKEALFKLGPLSILLDFTGLFHYRNGVANPHWCSTWPDHALVLVGYGTKDGDYWLIKNSWGPKWGLNGYLMLKRGAKKCAIDRWATTAVFPDK